MSPNFRSMPCLSDCTARLLRLFIPVLSTIARVIRDNSNSLLRSARMSCENIAALSLEFGSAQLELQYRSYRFNLTFADLIGRFGLLSVTSLVTCVAILGDFINAVASWTLLGVPGSLQRAAFLSPILAFGFYHQWTVYSNRLMTADQQ